MHLSMLQHYRAKYPRGRVHATEDAVDVFDAVGNHVVAVRKNGHGIWSDQSEEYGCKHRHCQAPLAHSKHVKEGRVPSQLEVAKAIHADKGGRLDLHLRDVAAESDAQ